MRAMRTQTPPVTRAAIARCAGPIILANAAVPLLGLVDTAVIGHFGTTAGLAALGLGALLFNFLYWSSGLLRMSTTGFIAQADGAGDEAEVRATLARALATGLALVDGRLPPDALVAQWRQQLPARGIDNGNVVDWLLHWDNALLLALRPHLPAGRLLAVLRDPRDMLLDWMSYGAALPLKLASADAAAQWLAQVLEQLVVLQEQDLYPLTVLRLDEVINNPEALAGVVGQALGVDLPAPRATPRRIPAGRWRAYADALSGPFAALTPVAVRLGYAEA